MEVPFENGRLRDMNEGDISTLVNMSKEEDISKLYFRGIEHPFESFWENKLGDQIPVTFYGASFRRKYPMVIEDQGEIKGFVDITLNLPVMALNDIVTDISYFVGGDYRRQGIAEKSLKTAVDFSFSELNAELVIAYCLEENMASQNLLTKLGFVHTGKVDLKNYSYHLDVFTISKED